MISLLTQGTDIKKDKYIKRDPKYLTLMILM